MGIDVEVYRPWWRLVDSLGSADRQRLEDLLAKQRFWDAHDLSYQLGVNTENFSIELERSDLYSGETFFLGELYILYGQRSAQPPLLPRILFREHRDEVVFLPSELAVLTEELALARRLGEKIHSPHLDLITPFPAFVDRWRICQDLRAGPVPDPWTLFAEGEELIFYRGTWKFGDPWDESLATRLRNPQWNGERFAYVETENGIVTEREFPIPHMREEMRELEEGDWTPHEDGYWIDAAGKNAAIPTHPLWEGPAELDWKPALEDLESTLGRLEKAVHLASEVEGIVVLG